MDIGGIISGLLRRSFVTLFWTLAGRTFLLIAFAVALTLGMAVAAGPGGASLLELGAGGLALAMLLTLTASRSLTQPFDRLIKLAHETEQTGYLNDFPADFPLVEINRLATALNTGLRAIRRSRTDLDKVYLQFVETMAQALDARDPYTAGHSLRVADYAATIACEMGISETGVEDIRIAAQLHDIGKIGIPDVVLQKPSRLTPHEYGLIKLHPQIGRKILEKVGRFAKFLAVVELHHENHDGTGYPYGISGDRIPIEVRIVHLADAFDAMTTTRSYRSALPLRAAIDELQIHCGTQFDPEVVRVFLKLIVEGRISIDRLEVTRNTLEQSGMLVETFVRLAG